MENQIRNTTVIIVGILFSILLPCSGALGVYYHASAASGFIVLSAYVMHRVGFTIRQIATVQLPIILFMVGVIVYNQLFHNIVLVLGMVLSFPIVPVYILLTKRVTFIGGVVATTLVAFIAYVAVGWMLFTPSTKNMDKELLSLNEIVMEDAIGADFQFPNDNKLYVVETWATNCGICFKRMPEFAQVENTFSNESRVVFKLMCLPLDRDTPNQAQTMLAERGITTQSVYAQQLKAWEQLDVTGVPNILLIQNGRILEMYNGGNIKLSKDPLLPDLEGKIETLLKEL